PPIDRFSLPVLATLVSRSESQWFEPEDGGFPGTVEPHTEALHEPDHVRRSVQHHQNHGLEAGASPEPGACDSSAGLTKRQRVGHVDSHGYHFDARRLPNHRGQATTKTALHRPSCPPKAPWTKTPSTGPSAVPGPVSGAGEGWRTGLIQEGLLRRQPLAN